MAVERAGTAPVRGFLLDITGVLYNSCHGTDGISIPGSIEAVKRLYAESRVCFLSNESTNTNENVVSRLGRLGFTVRLEDVITPAPVAAEYIRRNQLRPHVLVHPGIRSYFTALEQPDSPPNCVVMGDAEDEFTYSNVNAAFRVLMKMERPLLITLGNGKFYQRVDGPAIDVGAFAAALKFATNCEHVIIGKPQEDYFQSAVNKLGLKREEVLMIGDDIVSDIGGAQSWNIRGVQVRTGKWRPEWEDHPSVKPFRIVNNLQEAVDTILNNGHF
ncbi:hypothetical protein WR25_22292 [Diploscapter pachys]|uniref:Phospholysine phosphohistidine inorganic pyrophosphate phosphatase n=1 Tax=Diploscapter pachys TaxID=2018661 RepID=A0A2A2JTZ6_9BILA|nr:hypothetical protein WR25_22292 [Diploscapter pachys]